MKNKIFKNLIFFILAFTLLFNSFSYAEDNVNNDNTDTSGVYYTGEKFDRTEVSTIGIYDAKDGWKEYYKKFIVELGAVRFSFYNKDGSLFNSVNVLPPDSCFVQAENDKGVKRVGDTLEFYKAYVMGDKDVIVGGYFPFGKCNYVYVGDCCSSANIPLLTNYDELETYNYFTPWENAKNGKEWAEENNGENLNNLCEEIGVTFTNESGSKVTAMEWLGGGNSVVIEPVTFYPNATEEICCSSMGKASKYNLSYQDPILYALDGAYTKELTPQDKIDIKNGEYKGEDPVLLKYFGFDRWMHCGYMSIDNRINQKNGYYNSLGGDSKIIRHYIAVGIEQDETREWLDIWHGVKKEFFDDIGDRTADSGVASELFFGFISFNI